MAPISGGGMTMAGKWRARSYTITLYDLYVIVQDLILHIDPLGSDVRPGMFALPWLRRFIDAGFFRDGEIVSQ